MPPPTIFLQRCAPAISAREPTSAEPIGAPSPFEKQTDTESNGAAIARAVVRGSPPSAVAALKRRAPSRWVDRPRCFAIAHAASRYEIGCALPPIVFSRQSSRLLA